MRSQTSVKIRRALKTCVDSDEDDAFSRICDSEADGGIAVNEESDSERELEENDMPK